MGLIFLRHATNRFYEAQAAIEADKKTGKIPDRPLVEADFTRRRALNLPEAARFDVILRTPKDGNLGAALTAAMEAIEAAFPPLAGQLPKDYGRFEGSVLEEMMRMFDSEGLRSASGDVFGRIYEYFLAEFSKQGAHDGGEFFTPPSIVQTIVNVIEPDHGVILDPACGSGGMFVQSSHFIEDAGQDTMKRVTFYGHEKNETTARLAQINLAVHGLQGTIRAGNEAITYYKDPHELAGKCDFVMAQSALQRGRGGRREGEGRQAPALRPAGRQQGQEGFERQLSLAVLFLQLPKRDGPRGCRHVLAGVERGPG
jgi:type I restriction enzyme M protein